MKYLLIVAVAILTLTGCSKGGDLTHGGSAAVQGANGAISTIA